jgi:hypothetical protein
VAAVATVAVTYGIMAVHPWPHVVDVLDPRGEVFG